MLVGVLFVVCKIFVIIGFSNLQVQAQGSGNEFSLDMPSTCTEEFRQIPGHTMCMPDSWRVKKHGVSATDKQLIVDYHNEKRATVRPPATDLSALTWDDNLAAVAEKWAMQCNLDHDKHREIPFYGVHIGQNMAGGHLSWLDALSGWYNEVKDYQYGKPIQSYLGRGGFSKIGHYTQIVYNSTYRVGCGFADCTDSKYGRYYVCNYAIGQGNAVFPYTNGQQCSSCPQSCKRGLCDCGGKLCLNHGKLDHNTCTCTCPAIYGNDDCSRLNCPLRDPSYCGKGTMPPQACEKYINVPSLCPYMCGVCKSPSMTNQTLINSPAAATNWNSANQVPKTVMDTPNQSGVNAQPQRFQVVNNQCMFKGTKPSNAECRRLGLQGQDLPMCSQHSCDSCNIEERLSHLCPVLCGLCESPCSGKVCLNGGQLLPDSCQCSCLTSFSGENCEIQYVFKGLIDAVTTNISTSAPFRMTPSIAEKPFVSKFGCVYNSPRPSPEECKTYGEKGQDSSVCISKGGPIGCNACTFTSNFKYDYCPVMCGVCDPPCGGMMCMHGGILDTTTCTCTCKPPYGGSQCNTMKCPEKDEPVCSNYLPSFCNEYSNVPAECPYKCGLC